MRMGMNLRTLWTASSAWNAVEPRMRTSHCFVKVTSCSLDENACKISKTEVEVWGLHGFCDAQNAAPHAEHRPLELVLFRSCQVVYAEASAENYEIK